MAGRHATVAPLLPRSTQSLRLDPKCRWRHPGLRTSAGSVPRIQTERGFAARRMEMNRWLQAQRTERYREPGFHTMVGL